VLQGLVSFNKMNKEQIGKFESTVSRIDPTDDMPTEFKSIKKSGACCPNCWFRYNCDLNKRYGISMPHRDERECCTVEDRDIA
jgi:hypothetical protein